MVIHDCNPIHSASSPIGKASNIVAEMTGALEAARLLQDRPDLAATIVTDNEMLFKGMNEWRFGWKRRGWRKADGKPVANLDLWKQLDDIASTLPLLKWQWVRGHAGNEFNEMADALASDAALVSKGQSGV